MTTTTHFETIEALNECAHALNRIANSPLATPKSSLREDVNKAAKSLSIYTNLINKENERLREHINELENQRNLLAGASGKVS